jgi:hypothetical protein
MVFTRSQRHLQKILHLKYLTLTLLERNQLLFHQARAPHSAIFRFPILIASAERYILEPTLRRVGVSLYGRRSPPGDRTSKRRTWGGGAHYIPRMIINNSTSNCWTIAFSYTNTTSGLRTYLVVSNVFTRCQACQLCAHTSVRILPFHSATQPSYRTPQAPSILYPSRALSVVFDPLRVTNAFTQYEWCMNTSWVG